MRLSYIIPHIFLGSHALATNPTIYDQQKSLGLSSENVPPTIAYTVNFHENWDIEEDKGRMEYIRKGVAQALILVQAAKAHLPNQNTGFKNPKFNAYFGLGVQPNSIRSLYDLFDEVKAETARSYIDDMIFMKEDAEKQCGDPRDPDKVMGYNYEDKKEDDQGKFRSRIHICDYAYTVYDLPSWDTKQCKDALGTRLSTKKMITFATIILHEMLHHRPLGEDSLVGKHLRDLKYGPENLYAYGVCGVRELAKQLYADPDQNADNYAWYAQEMWYQDTCGYVFDEPKDTSTCSIF